MRRPHAEAGRWLSQRIGRARDDRGCREYAGARSISVLHVLRTCIFSWPLPRPTARGPRRPGPSRWPRAHGSGGDRAAEDVEEHGRGRGVWMRLRALFGMGGGGGAAPLTSSSNLVEEKLPAEKKDRKKGKRKSMNARGRDAVTESTWRGEAPASLQRGRRFIKPRPRRRVVPCRCAESLRPGRGRNRRPRQGAGRRAASQPARARRCGPMTGRR